MSRGTKDEKQKRSKINKKGIIVTLIVLVALATTITVWKALEDKKQEKLFSKKVAEKQAEKEKTLKSIDYKTIIGTWYSIEVYAFEETFTFKENGEAIYDMRDLDEDLEDHEPLDPEVSEFKYTLKVKKGEIIGKNEKFDYEYIIDGEDTRLVLKYKEENTTRTYYKSVYKAREKSEFYTSTNEFMKEHVDKDGWVIIDGELYGYFGKAISVTVPKNVKIIKSSAFSSDYNRGTKLMKVTIPGNVKEIQAGAFAFTVADKIVIEEGVEIIGDDCFSDSYIDVIYFPKSVTKIGERIMETEEGLDGCVVHCVKDSPMAKHFKEYEPYGKVKIKYE